MKHKIKWTFVNSPPILKNRCVTTTEYYIAFHKTKVRISINHFPKYSTAHWYKIYLWGLPWWCSDWESACQFRGHGFEPWSGKIPHAAEQLGPWAITTEPARLEPVLGNNRGCDSERPAHHDEEWPPLAATRESPRTETKTQHSQK